MNQPVNEFNKKEVILAVIVSATIGAGAVGGGVFVYEQNDATEQSQQNQPYRYPLETEINIVQGCYVGNRSIISAYYPDLNNKVRWQVCLCALHETQKGYSLDDYRTKHSYFLTEFNVQYQQCRSSIR